MAIGKLPGSAITSATVDTPQLSANVTNKSNNAYLQANNAYAQANAAYAKANTGGFAKVFLSL